MDYTISKPERLAWVDVFKFFGMWSIYIGHYATTAGRAYPFVFTFHVFLFFFAAGLFADSQQKYTYGRFLWVNCKRIVFPYFFFSILTIIGKVLVWDTDVSEIFFMLKQTLRGVRNELPAPSLWFLTCLFIIIVGYETLRRILRKKWLVLLVSIALRIVFEIFFVSKPGLLWSADQACQHMFFYAVGNIAFPYIQKLFVPSPSIRKRWVLAGITCVLGAYATFLLFWNDYLERAIESHALRLAYVLLRTLLLLTFFLLVAYFLADVRLFQRLGRDTLYLCGNEELFKQLLIPQVFAIIGLNVAPSNAAQVLIYTFGALVLISFFVNPVERALYEKIQKGVASLFQRRPPSVSKAHTLQS